MANKTVSSNTITFMDITDSVRLDLYIASNLPTTQIYDANTSEYQPDWTVENLVLTPTAYRNSMDITSNITSFTWTRRIGNNAPEVISTNRILTIATNELNNSVSMVTYACKVVFDEKEATEQITFTRSSNGADGVAVNMIAQYSADGVTSWTTVLDSSVHKYIRFSYDDGETWTDAIRISGDDAKNIILSGSSQVFKINKDNVITPETITVQAQVINTSVTTWTYSTDGGKNWSTTLPIGVTKSSNVVTITGKSMTENSIVIKASDGTYSDVFTVYKALDGYDAPIAFLTNENISFSANSNGQITATSFTTNVVAYNGVSKITPTVGTPSGLPTGITYTGLKISSNELELSFSVASNATLGTTANTNGVITIPVISPINTNLQLTWNKVNAGAKGDQGIQGPKGNDGQQYYTWVKYADTPTSGMSNDPTNKTYIGLAYNKTTATESTTYSDYAWSLIRGATGAIGPKGEDGQQYYTWIKYADNASGANMSDLPDGKLYIGLAYNKTTSTESNVASDYTWALFKGDKGDAGRGISKITEYYLATTSSSEVTTATSGWTTTIQSIDATKKYLWNYEVVTYTDGATSPTTPIIIGVFGNTGATGKGISSVTERYLATASSSGITTSTTGWTPEIQTLTATKKYLWNYEIITYTDGTTSTINPVIIGVYGDKGDQGPKGNDAYTVMLTNESHIFAGDVSNAIAGTAETQVLAYNGSTAQSVTITSVNGKTATTTDADTGIAGLKFKCSALSGTDPKITFTCTTAFVSKSGSIPIVLSVGGISFTKMFTYSIAFKGSTGSQGGTGTPASLVDITPSALYFKSTTGKDGAFTPDYIYLYPRFQTVTYSKWEYSINGGTTWIAASGANGLSIGVYNSIANTLRIAKTSTLYTDTVTSISFRCVSSNISVYDTVSIAKIYDVVDLQIGGRNLLLNTSFDGGLNKIYNLPSSITSGEGGLTFNLSEPLPAGTEVALRFQIRGLANVNVYWMMTGGNVAQTVRTKDNISATEFSTIEVRYTIPAGKTLNSVFICTAYGNSVAGTDWFEIKTKSLQLELGNTFTDWSPSPDDLISTTFQLYAPKGSLITKDIPEVTLETFAYDGSQPISGATFVWYSWVNDTWVTISGVTGTSLTLNKDSVLKSNVYKCKMTYKGKVYESTATVEDKTDIYESIMCISSNARGNDCYWVLYTLVYTDAEEVDPLLGPISINAPASPASGDYWYAVDATNATVTLKKYNGTSWAVSTDTQSLSYYWDMINDGSTQIPLGDSAKVKVISCHDFTSTATLVCEVSNLEDGLLTQSSLSLTDASDPIVSDAEPTATVNGQIWIKPNDNGTYLMFIWDESTSSWISSDMDTRSKVYTSRPSSYNVGDLWITASDTDHGSYLQGTLLQAQAYNTTYNAADWSPTLRYDQDLDDVKETLNNLSQYVTITSSGLRVAARDDAGKLSEFTSLFTSEALTFYQGSKELLVLANHQLTAPKIVVEDELEVQGEIKLGDLKINIESNGSFSFVIEK